MGGGTRVEYCTKCGEDMLFHKECIPRGIKASSHPAPEVRITDPKTGGEKGKKETELGFVDPLSLMELGKVAGVGSKKYDKFNYLKGYDWSLSYNAAQRHANQGWSGENIDDETKCVHFAMAAWHFLALTSFYLRKIGNDDRPKV